MAYWSLREFTEGAEWVSHTHQVMERLQALLGDVEYVEVLTRNYVIVGDERYRAQISGVRGQIRTDAASIAELVRDNPKQEQNLSGLLSLISRHMDLLAKAAETRRSRGEEQALAIIASDAGKESLEQIRSMVSNMNAIERKLLRERAVRFDNVAGHSKVAIVIGTTAAFGFLALAVVFIFRVLGSFREATAVAAREAAAASEQRRQVQRQNEALVRSEVRFRKLLEFAPDAMVVINPRGEIVFLNPLAEQMFGYSAQELLGANIDRLVPDRFRATHGQHREGFMAAPRARLMGDGLELYGRRKDGTEFPVDVRLNPIESPDGLLVSSTIRDLTERKRAEQNRALLEALVEATQYAIITVARDGTVLTWNSGAERMYGYPAAEMIGKTVDPLVPPEEKTWHQRRDTWLDDVPGPTESEAKRLRKDGRSIYISQASAPIRGAGGRTVALSTISADVTERKRVEHELIERTNELARSNAELEQFAYVASHDLQEPLRMVISYLQLLERKYKGRLEGDADEFIGYAIDGATRMRSLITDLLQFSRAGRFERIMPVEMGEVVERAVSSLEIAIGEAGATVTYDPLPPVMGDESHLYEVVLNLLNNALKFHGERPPRIHVGCKRKGTEWTFTVRDNGIGIAPEYNQRIFVMFQRLHGRDKYPGTGMGLAICKRVIERLGGKMWVESEPGQGATFYFTLPAASLSNADLQGGRNGTDRRSAG